MSTIVQHSLVTHPVGFHLDAYSRQGHGDVIENKICLVNIQKSNKKCKNALGRGGYGPGRYVFEIHLAHPGYEVSEWIEGLFASAILVRTAIITDSQGRSSPRGKILVYYTGNYDS